MNTGIWAPASPGTNLRKVFVSYDDLMQTIKDAISRTASRAGCGGALLARLARPLKKPPHLAAEENASLMTAGAFWCKQRIYFGF